MTHESLGIVRIKDSCFRYTSTIVKWLVEPSAVTDERLRRRVRLLSAFLLLFSLNLLVGVTTLINTSDIFWIPLAVTDAICMIGYGFSRSKYHKVATVIAVSITSFPSIIIFLFATDHAYSSAVLMWLAMPLLISSLLLSLRQTIITAVAYIFVLIIITSFGSLDSASLAQMISFFLMIFFFTIAIKAIRQQDTSDVEHELIERKKAEEGLQESEAKFRNLSEQSPNMIFINKQGRIVYANKQSEDVMGYTREEFYSPNFNFLTLIAPKYRGLFMERFRTHIKNAESPFDEFSLVTKDGREIDCTLNSKLIDYEGSPAILGTVADITERKQAEEKARESEEKFRSIVENSSDQIFMLDKNYKYLSINKTAADISKKSPQEMIGMSIFEIFPDDIAAKFSENIKNVFDIGKSMLIEEKMIAQGREFENSTSLNPVKDHKGSVRAVTGIVRDVTDRKQAEEKLKQNMANLEQSSARLAASNKELEAFSYSVSHDLRSPLRSIDGFSQALLEDYKDKLDATGRDYLRRLRSASQKMGELIDGLLKLSRLSRSEIHREKVDMSALADEIATRLREANPERKGEFTIGGGLTADGDAQLLRALLENLLGNAWKFTGKVPLAKIEFGAVPNSAPTTFFVKDNGAGFDMTYVDKLFGAFQRLHDTTDFPGTGIGLATVRRIINRHGGTVRAEGEVGKGAAFYFTLD